MKFLKRAQAKLSKAKAVVAGSSLSVATSVVNAAPVDIDTTEITTSVTNIGGKAVALVLVIAGFYVAYRIIRGMIR